MIEKRDLFHVPCWKIQVNNFKEKKKKLIKILESFPEKEIQDFDTNRQTNRFGLVEKFHSIMGEEMEEFSRDIKKDFAIHEMWSITYDKGDHHASHNHGSIGLTGILYLDLPKDSPKTDYIQPWNDYEDDTISHKRIPIVEGDIVIVPSFVLHFSRPNKSNSKKRIVSWDMKIVERKSEQKEKKMIPQKKEMKQNSHSGLRPWMDVRLPEELMNFLRNALADTTQHKDANTMLAGNVSKSMYIEDKDNWFYDNALKEMMEHMYFNNSWKNYYNVKIGKIDSLPTFEMTEMWANYQKQYEFNPPHTHDGLYSFVVFMKIPTHWKEQHALPMSANSNIPCSSNFQFLLVGGGGKVQVVNIPLSPEDEGRMLFFPAWMVHQVLPFYGTEEERITISGNIVHKEQYELETLSKNEIEITIQEYEKKAQSLRDVWNHRGEGEKIYEKN